MTDKKRVAFCVSQVALSGAVYQEKADLQVVPCGDSIMSSRSADIARLDPNSNRGLDT